MARRLVLLTTIVAVLLGAAGAVAQGKPRAKARLATFDSCGELVRYARGNVRRAGVAGVPTAPPLARPTPPPLVPMPSFREDGMVAMPVSASAGEAAAGGDATSTTNVQEAGVDEPDVVKTDGRTLFVIASGRLMTLDATSPAPRILSTLELEGWGHELLLHEGRLLVVSRIAVTNGAPGSPTGPPGPQGPPEPGSSVASDVLLPSRGTTRLTELDVADPAAPKVLRTQDVEGDHVASRLHQGTARVVVASSPDALALARPARAPLARRAAGWVPQTTVASAAGGTRTRLVTGCDDVARPRTFSGLGTVTLLTVDLSGTGPALPAADADTIVSDAQTVYASPRSVVVATQRDLQPGVATEDPPKLSTALHRFDATERRSTTYSSSGVVAGTLLNQFSLSEHRGVLRAATTDWPLWWGPVAAPESESFVTTLAERGGRLEEAGRVDGLGRGERIYAVRFLGDVGYVVTFRQTDPLYTLDLAEPERPRVLGELKIPGYSAYLHPVGDDLVLGVGQDATDEGMRTGAQVSLFDVRDLRAPKRLAQHGFGQGAWTPVEGDHRAFLHWPATGLAVLPVISYGRDAGFAGAVGLRVGRDAGLAEVGRAVHEGEGERATGQVERTLVVGGRIFTVSGEGVEVGRLDTLAEQAFTRFPPPPG